MAPCWPIGGAARGAQPAGCAPSRLPPGSLEGPTLVLASELPHNTTVGMQRLSPLEHSALLACVNPKAWWFPYRLDPGVLKNALGVVLNQAPSLAGRLVMNPARTDCPDPAAQPVESTPPTTFQDPRQALTDVACQANGMTAGQGIPWKQPSRFSGPRSVRAAALANARATQSYCVALCNAGALMRVVYAPQWTLERTFPWSALSRTGFACGPSDPNPNLPPWFEPVDVTEMLRGRAPVLSVRVTLLGCGGTILSVTPSHALTDGQTVSLFMERWAATYAALAPASLVPRAPQPAPDALVPGGAPGSKATPQLGPFTRPSVAQRAHLDSLPALNLHRHLLCATHPPPSLPSAPATAPQSVPASGTGPAVLTGSRRVVSVAVRARVTDPPAAPAPTTASVPAMRTGAQPAVRSSTGAYMRAMVLGSASPPRRGPAVTPSASGTAPAPGARPMSGAATAGLPSGPPTPPATLKCLGVQRLPDRSSLRGAVRAVLAAAAAQKQEERVFPGVQTDLTSSLFHLPAPTVARVKALAGAYSSNDAIASLVWVLLCDVRRRPLPGTRATGHATTNVLGMAVDLRQNGFSGYLPRTLIGNCTWGIHVPACPPAGAHVHSTPQAPAPPAVTTAAAPVLVQEAAEEEVEGLGGQAGDPLKRAVGGVMPVGVGVQDVVREALPSEQQPPEEVWDGVAPALGTMGGAAAASVKPVSVTSAALRVEGTPLDVRADEDGPDTNSAVAATDGDAGVLGGSTVLAAPVSPVLAGSAAGMGRPVTPPASPVAPAAPPAASLVLAALPSPEVAPDSSVPAPAGPASLALPAPQPQLTLAEAWAAAVSAKPPPNTPSHRRSLPSGRQMSRSISRSCSASVALAQSLPRFASGGVGGAWPAGPVGEGAEGNASEGVRKQATGGTAQGGRVGGAGEATCSGVSGEVSPGGSMPCDQWEASLQYGAAAIRAAVLELRGSCGVGADGPGQVSAAQSAVDSAVRGAGARAGGAAAQQKRLPPGSTATITAGAGASQEKGWEVLSHARSVVAGPAAGQLEMMFNLLRGLDLMLTSWQFPYWSGVNFGRGGPVRMQGVLAPSPSWALAIMPAPPDMGGYLLQITTPTSAVRAVVDSPVWGALAPGAVPLTA